ncbi:HAMP domain-containing histidine kinase [Thermoleophilia bacterium SCSIO 60948]|nr:HAMP domain-containing histidine kinase [Thermoleophilia bacterium SCSIO 60948]
MTVPVGVAELATAAGPAALSMAAVVLGARVRGDRRRRDLNRSLHELRRPLQALVLGGSRDHLERAIDALAELDRRVNGEDEHFEPRPVGGRDIVERAAERWRDAARRRGGDVRVEWAAGEVILAAEPRRLAAALDNLLANAIEHGRGRIDVLASVSPIGLRVAVVNDPRMIRRPRPPRLDPRRGHGLWIARSIAQAHRGDLRCGLSEGRHLAALELPVIAERAPGRLVAAA